MKVSKQLFAAALALTLVASACGDDDSETSDAADTTTTGGDATETEDGTESESESESESEGDGAGASGTAADPSLEPVTIGWLNQDEGVPSFPGSTKGADVAVEYINSELGGIDGHPVELVKCSPGLDEASNQACAQEMANNADVDVISSGFLIGSPPVYPVLQAAGKPILGGSPLNISDFTQPGAYFYSPGTPGIIGGMPEFVLNHLDGEKPDKAAILISDNDAGRAALPLIQPELEAAGIEVTVVSVPDDATDLVGPITAAGATDADVFFPLVSQPTCIQVANALQNLGVDVTVVTTQLCADSAVREAVNEGIQGWYVGGNGPAPKLGMGVDDELDVYLTAFETYGDDPDDASLGGATGGFANIMVLAQLASEIGVDNLTSEAWSEALSSYTGAMFLGAPRITCPGPVLPNLCTTQYKMLQVAGDGFEPAGPDFIDSIENN